MNTIDRTDLKHQLEILDLLERAGFSTDGTVEAHGGVYGISGYTITLQYGNAQYSERGHGKLNGTAMEVKRLLKRLAGPEVKEGK